jgi:hypothetical protein
MCRFKNSRVVRCAYGWVLSTNVLPRTLQLMRVAGFLSKRRVIRSANSRLAPDTAHYNEANQSLQCDAAGGLKGTSPLLPLWHCEPWPAWLGLTWDGSWLIVQDFLYKLVEG